jgi:uncharacterized membrane protein YccC
VPGDPDGVVLRHALRVTVVGVPLVVVLGPVLDRWQAVGPAVFAVFTLGSFADFSGLPVRRAERYLLVGLVAALMLGLGTAAGQHPVTAVVATGLVTFATFALGCLGGPWFTARFPVIIAWLYAVTAPSWAALSDRVLGWLAGTLLIAVAALVLWPLRPRHSARSLAGKVCRQSASVLRTGISAAPADTDALGQTVQSMRRASGAAHLYPGAVAGNERLTAEIVHLTERLACVLLVDPPRGSGADEPLAAAAGAAAERVGAVLDPPGTPTAPSGPPKALAPDLEALLARPLRSAPADADAGREPWVEAALDEADGRYRAAIVLALARLTEQFERVVAGAPEARPRSRGDDAWTTLRAHLTLRSLWCRDAVRAAAALMLSIAVIAAGAGAGHAFWVALGTFSVLRADLVSTGRSARATLVGTGVGFVLASALVLAGEQDRWLLWAALPVTMFLASWTGRFRPEVTSAAFTTFLVGMYALAAPDGLATAEARVVTVLVGAAVTLVVGAVLWPRPGSLPPAALAQVVTDARGWLAQAVDTVTTEPSRAGSPGRRLAWASPLPVLSELDRALDTIATSAPGSIDEPTRRLVVATVDAAVATTDLLAPEPDAAGATPAASLAAEVTADVVLAQALQADAADADAALAALADRLTLVGSGSSPAEPSALPHVAGASADGARSDAAVRLGAGLRRVVRASRDPGGDAIP